MKFTMETKNLFNRVYNDKMIIDEKTKQNDELDIKAIITEVWGDGNVTPDISTVHNFNNLLVELADEVAQARKTDVIPYLADASVRKRNDLVKFSVPQKIKTKFVWGANGSGVDLIRVGGKKQEIAVPQTFDTGFYYEPDDLVEGSVESFRKLINDLADAKVRLYLEQIQKLIGTAITATKIPAKNVKSGANISITQYNELASTLSRYGGRPIFIGDTLLIDHFAALQTVTSDLVKDSILFDLQQTRIGRTIAINLINPFTDKANAVTDLPVNEGYMLAGEAGVKPFKLVEYGAMRQETYKDFETGRIMIKIFQDAAVLLLFPQVLGYVKDTTITL